MTINTPYIPAGASESYMEWVRRFPLRSINDDETYEVASEIISELAVRGEEHLDAGERLYLDTLTELVEGYQARTQVSVPESSPLAVLKHLCAETGLRQTDLARILNISESAVSMILHGTRAITAEHARALAQHFGLDAGVFI